MEENIMKKLYLACPFSHRFFLVRWYRYVLVTYYAARLMKAGYVVFSPITHSMPVAFFLPKRLMQSWTFWKRQDIPWLIQCDVLGIIPLKGWQGSVGVTAEKQTAERLGMPVIMIDRYRLGVMTGLDMEDE